MPSISEYALLSAQSYHYYRSFNIDQTNAQISATFLPGRQIFSAITVQLRCHLTQLPITVPLD